MGYPWGMEKLEPLEITASETDGSVVIDFNRSIHLERALSEQGCVQPAFGNARLRVNPNNPTLVAHNVGAERLIHLLDDPCAQCRPPIIITDAIVDRAAVFITEKLIRYMPRDDVRALLEAAFNG